MKITIMETSHDPVSDFFSGKWYWAVHYGDKALSPRIDHGHARSEDKARKKAEGVVRKYLLKHGDQAPRNPVYYTYEV